MCLTAEASRQLISLQLSSCAALPGADPTPQNNARGGGAGQGPVVWGGPAPTAGAGQHASSASAPQTARPGEQRAGYFIPELYKQAVNRSPAWLPQAERNRETLATRDPPAARELHEVAPGSRPILGLAGEDPGVPWRHGTGSLLVWPSHPVAQPRGSRTALRRGDTRCHRAGTGSWEAPGGLGGWSQGRGGSRGGRSEGPGRPLPPKMWAWGCHNMRVTTMVRKSS